MSYGSADAAVDYPMLRAVLVGAVYAALVPGAPMPVAALRSELFRRYGIDWERYVPPDAEAPGGTYREDLSRFFAPESRGTSREGGREEGRATDVAGQSK